MELTQHQVAAGVTLRAALAALLLTVAMPVLAQVEAEPEPLTQGSAGSGLIAREMFTALVAAFQSHAGTATQVQHFAQNHQPPTLPQAPSPLGVEQVRRAPASAPGATPQAKAAQSDALQSPGIRPGVGAVGLPQADTSTRCQGDNASAECLLPGQAAVDWKKQTGVEPTPISGAPFIPGVSLNPTGR